MAGLVAAIALQPALCGDGPQRRIQIHGSWDEWNPDLFRVDAELSARRSYTIANNTTNTITVMQVELVWDDWLGDYARTPRDYFPVVPGKVQLLGTPNNLQGEVYTLDLNLRGMEDDKLNGQEIVLKEAGPELITD